MAIKVLVVDDSGFFRRRLTEIVNQDPNLHVVGAAANGAEAVKLVAELHPNVVIMDIEMPVMDGITAVKKIMASTPVPILMFSSLTHEGAQATLEALDAGALDFLPKRFEYIASNKEDAISLLQQRITALGRRRLFKPLAKPKRVTAPARPVEVAAFSTHQTAIEKVIPQGRAVTRPSGKKYKALLIGTSTGGPVALQKVLLNLPKHYPYPILLIQHMPAAFTKAFAMRLNSLCNIEIKEAESGDVLKPGCAYLAPGGKQMLLERGGAYGRINVMEGKEELNYKPSVDITFASASKVLGGDVLAIVLTGMGADGRDGARLLKSAGANIWAQDEDSSVVYGMPQAVTKAGLSSQSLPLDSIGKSILIEMGCH